MSNGPDEAEEFTFVCPNCGESMTVNGPMKEALVEKGCVICGASLTSSAFSEPTAAGSQ